MNGKRKLRTIISKSFLENKIVGVIDRDVSSFTYISALESLQEPLDAGKYVWVVSYEPLQSLLRDLRRAGVKYEKYLGRNFYILDVFGSIRHIDSEVDGVFVLSGYLDDRVFILKYKALIRELLSQLEPSEVIVLGYLESGMCRLFDNPVRTQKLLWDLREESEVKISGLITYIKPECPQLEEFIYLYSDTVIEGFIEGNERKILITKGDAK